MSAQDKIENVLRDLHILLSKSEVYDKEKGLVVVNKKEMLGLFTDLNKCIYEMLDEYELTERGRDQAAREVRKKGDEIIADANKKAEDVYAASVLYTDEALKLVQDIMQEASDSIKEVYEKLETDLQKEKQRVRKDQSDLTGYLQDLKDTDEYLKLIEERNKKLAKEKQKEKEAEPSAYAAVKPEIRINEEYFREHGLLLEEEEQPEEEKEPVTAEVNVNLDSEYFKWKEREQAEGKPETAGAGSEKKQEKHSLFGKIIKNE